MNLIADFVGLLFPWVCRICGNSLYKNESIVCSRCFLHLPETNFHRHADNPVSRVFWGRVPLQLATALLYYRKGGPARKLIHQLKYNGDRAVGTYLGQLLGSALLESETFKSVDCILPVPLHSKKQKRRGFNQSEIIALGIEEVTQKELKTNSLRRVTASDSQTRKTRYSRWENVREIFVLSPNHDLDHKHVLILDDVITTGSTMEACMSALQEVEGITLSAAAVAFAQS